MKQKQIVLDIEKEVELLQSLELKPTFRLFGKVSAVSDGVVLASGLSEGMVGELVRFQSGVFGVILNLQETEVGIIVLGEFSKIRQGDEIEATGKVLQVRGSFSFLGRVVDPLGKPLDGRGKVPILAGDLEMPVERVAAGIVERQDVRVPLQTGIKTIDALIPIGRGQRELIIGDRGIGKSAIAIDAIINQSRINAKLKKGEKRVLSIYVAIGQKQSKIAQVAAKLAELSAVKDTIVVATSASDAASLQYLAPFCAMAMAEYFMSKGEDVLIVFDDLSKHAWAYRELSLLLRRPSGREAYPGDIFYLHSRLLERAARMSEENGGGSITALPIIETQAGDISAYIPTNVISITDGQIYLESELFYSGVRPAVSVGLSVSRVGGDAQTKAMKQVAGTLKLDLAQFRELAAFAQFGSDLDETTQKRIRRGTKITKVLNQKQYTPLPLADQLAGIWAAVNGYLDDVADERIADFLDQFLTALRKADLLTAINDGLKISDETQKKMESEVLKLKKRFSL